MFYVRIGTMCHIKNIDSTLPERKKLLEYLSFEFVSLIVFNNTVKKYCNW